MYRRKTGKEIETDLRSLIIHSSLARGVNGKVYRGGYRPRDSKKEDIVVSFLEGTATLPQRGIVNVYIYVPDILSKDNVPIENGQRTDELETLAANWLDGINGMLGYDWWPDEAIHTENDEEIHQHFVYLKLNFKLI